MHRRVAQGFVTDCQLDGDTRVITVANGMVVRERIVTVDEAARRIAPAASADGLTHHNASFEVLFERPRRTRVIWIADLLPDDIERSIGAMMDQGSRDEAHARDGRDRGCARGDLDPLRRVGNVGRLRAATFARDRRAAGVPFVPGEAGR